jgi:hydrogenase expression/formation protein HypD
MMSKFQDYSTLADEYRETANVVIKAINDKVVKLNREIRVMHVCGTHEGTVARSGIRSVIDRRLRIISGPGCPVCICPAEHISMAIELADNGAIITTFGDMLKVPDVKLESLAKAKSRGCDVRICYSVREALEIAKKNPEKKVVWLGVGFETTAPMTSFAISQGVPNNFYVLTDFRLVPPALDLLMEDPDQELDGIILPGHVMTITGTEDYEKYPQIYKKPFVVGGFEAVEFLIALDDILDQLVKNEARLVNKYPKVVTKEGNILAKNSIQKVFDIVDAKWRGIGLVPNSGYELKEEYSNLNARNLLSNSIVYEFDLPKGCKCGKVILGKVEPEDCAHYLKRCTPETPIGPCMVSDEGTCRIRAVYKQILEVS